MQFFRIVKIAIPLILFLFVISPNRYTYGRDIGEDIDNLRKKIEELKHDKFELERRKKLLDTGEIYIIHIKYKGSESYEWVKKDDFLRGMENLKPWEAFAKTQSAKSHNKHESDLISADIQRTEHKLAELRKKLAKLENEINQRHREGYAYIEARVNRERYSQPRKNLHRWDWQIRFDETNGVGVKIYECWERGYRGSTEEVKRRTPMNVYVSPYGSAFIDTVFMQYSTYHDKTRSGTMKFIYNGIDDNGNKVQTELLELTRFPPK